MQCGFIDEIHEVVFNAEQEELFRVIWKKLSMKFHITAVPTFKAIHMLISDLLPCEGPLVVLVPVVEISCTSLTPLQSETNLGTNFHISAHCSSMLQTCW